MRSILHVTLWTLRYSSLSLAPAVVSILPAGLRAHACPMAIFARPHFLPSRPPVLSSYVLGNPHAVLQRSTYTAQCTCWYCAMCSWPCLPGQFVDLAKGELTVVDNPIAIAREFTTKCNTRPRNPMQEQQLCALQETIAGEKME